MAALTDLGRLREAFPAWRFTSCWSSAAHTEIRRNLLAVRKTDGVIVGGLSEEEITEKINREEGSS